MVAPFTQGSGAEIRLAAAPLTRCSLLPVYTLPVVSMFRRPVTTGRFQRAASPLCGFPHPRTHELAWRSCPRPV